MDGSMTATKESVINKLQGDLATEITNLEDLLALLGDRLLPVSYVSPMPESNAKEVGPDQPFGSPVASFLQGQTERVIRARKRVDALIMALEV